MCEAGKVEDVQHLFNSLSLKGLQPDVITYNTIISGLGTKRLYYRKRMTYL
ncbi:hypothetical protein EYS10_02425 (plasmid) [Rahnella aquatilis]|nr:hypothetical protein EYS10_02425 [Rahnella aquatilis]